MSNDHGESGPPFSLSFEQADANTIRFKASLGPVATKVYEANMAMDFRKELITHWAFDGTSYREGCAKDYVQRNGSSGRFDQIRSPCRLVVDGNLLGYVGVVATGTSPAWWDVSGGGTKVRVTIDKARSTNLKAAGFTRHPGTHNIGFSFGDLDKSQSARLEGLIRMTR